MPPVSDRVSPPPRPGALTPEAQISLATRVCAGDGAAEDELALLFQKRVWLMVRSRVRDAETARDLSQEVLLAVVMALRQGKLREGARLAAFVYGTARNVVNGHFRAKPPECEPLLAETVACEADDVVQRVHERRVMERLMKSLDATDRRILGLTLGEGLKPGEIAERLGLSPEVVRARKARAIKRAVEQMSGPSARPRSASARER